MNFAYLVLQWNYKVNAGQWEFKLWSKWSHTRLTHVELLNILEHLPLWFPILYDIFSAATFMKGL